MFSLEGKVALVTGGAMGIGLSIVKDLLRNNVKGVTLVDINENKGQLAVNEIEKEFDRQCTFFVKADVSDREDVKAAFEATIERFNQLDIVINNAGIVQEFQWEKCTAINFIGVINGSMLAMEQYIPKYKIGDEGVIVNIASLASLLPMTENPVYCGTKAGAMHFTRSIGTEIRYEKHRVRAIAICPGYTDTNMLVVNEDQGDETARAMLLKHYNELPKQKPEVVATSVIKAIKEGSNGSVWVVRGGNCFKIEFPNLF